VRSADDVHEVFRLRALGMTHDTIAAATGVSVSTMKRWFGEGEDAVLAPGRRGRECGSSANCALAMGAPSDSYAYLLGQYLGDGHIVYAGKGAYRLEITCCAAYPNIIEECADAIGRVLPNKVTRRRRPGVINVGCFSKHLPCLFPQHGPGPKHLRPIVLEPWQENIALVEHKELFVRGLIHSDGWRGTNNVRGANGMPYAYPRYMFCNHSDDIRRLFTLACDRLGVRWRQTTAYDISVARRDSVALLDQFVGLKS
jgi:hypothetical protein